jgi:nucleoside-diphosphate-sugar epimerase
MSVAIVGGLGFVGSALSRWLQAEGVSFAIYDSANHGEPAHFLDVTDEESLRVLEQSTAIINLAAEHRDDVSPKSRYYDVNVSGAKNVCNAAIAYEINCIVFTSSVAIYGFAPPNTDENGAPNPFNEYGRTKLLAEQVYLEWQRSDPENRTLVIVRPTVIFGPGNRGNVFNLLRQVASRRFVMLGRGDNIKSMAYVENVAKFLAHTLSFQAGVHIYNYVDKPDMDVNSLVKIARAKLFALDNVGVRVPGWFGILIGFGFDICSKIVGKPLPVSSIRVKKFISTTQFDSAAVSCGFQPDYSLTDGLNKTLEYEFLEDNSGKKTFITE